MLDLSMEYSAYYAERASERERARQVGWRDERAQLARFGQLARAIDHAAGAAFDVADIGCGLGDLLPFLRAAGFSRARYAGYDVLPGMVEAATAHHRDPDAAFRPIRDMAEVAPADYCFASGIFNARNDHADEVWEEHVRVIVRAMVAKSRCAVAFNMLSTYSDEDRRDASLFYVDPGAMFAWCKRELTSDVALLHDYGHWDFTIVLRTGGAKS